MLCGDIVLSKLLDVTFVNKPLLFSLSHLSTPTTQAS